MRSVRSFGAHLGMPLVDELLAAPPLFVRVSFEVSVETEWGETVAVVGDAAQLGGWQPEHGVRMTTCESTYPIWRCEPLLLSEDGVIEYKFVVMNESTGTVRWEPLSHNRQLEFSGTEMQVVADWGSPDALPPSSSVGSLTMPAHSDGGMPRAPPRVDSATNTGVHGATCADGGAGTAGAGTGTAGAGASGGTPCRLLVVQQHLPFNVQRAADGSWGGSWDEWDLLVTSAQGGRHLMGSLDVEVIFVGSLRQRVPEEAQEEVTALLAKYNCSPVFLTEHLYNEHCDGYGPTILLPILHNQIPDRHGGGKGGDGIYVSSLYAAYVKANEAFAEATLRLSRPGDLIWVHAYPLMLVPAALRARHPPAHVVISFFLHSPCPSPEVWRVIPHRAELLRGMLAADVVGFHLFEYARHFMTSSRRLLGLGDHVGSEAAGGALSIDYHGRQVTITVSHVGIDRDVLCHRLDLPEVQTHEARLRERCRVGERIVVGGVEMLNPLQGAQIKLLAYEKLLENYAMWRPRLTMLQVCFPDRARPNLSARASADNRLVVRRIQQAFGDDAIHYMEIGEEIEPESWTVNFRLALFRVIDLLLNCAMKDGLNLLPFEYVLTKSVQKSSGAVVLSEFVGCAHVLNGCVRINPFNIEHVVEQLDSALSMSPNERAARLSKDYTFVSSNTTSAWLNVAVQDMRRARACLTAGKTPSRSTLGLCDFGTETVAGQPLPTLSPEALVRAYWQANRRLIVLGLDGTLIQQEKVLDHLKLFHDFIGRSLAPPPAALHCLQALASDPANSVHVISGRGARDLEACLGSVRGLGLAAELGFCVLRPHGDVWAKRELTPTQERWKDAARPIFERFMLRTNGVYMQWQESAARWCYHNADPDYGRFQARQLTTALKEHLKGAGVSISHSSAKCQVEVRIAGVNKGTFADAALLEAQAAAPVDFVLCIGDDEDDEYMLSALTARASHPSMLERLHGRFFTVTVGAKEVSHGRYVVESTRTVLQILQTLHDAHAS